MGLNTEEFSKAFQRIWFNISVQVFNFGVDSAVVFGVSRGLNEIGVLPQALADGMTICSCLSLSINMVLVLTKSSGGDEASAVFHAAFGNMCGVFLSPLLILGYLGVSASVDLWEVFYKLALRVVVPVAIGQLLQKFSPSVVNFVSEHKYEFKQAQQYLLIYIVYTVFCTTFAGESSEATIGEIFIMIAVQFCLLCSLMVLSWYTFKVGFPNEPKLRVMALFGSTHKTIAMGVPLIKSMYEDDPLVGLYLLSILIWHPMQLVIGSFLAPMLSSWVEKEQERLSLTVSNPQNDTTAPSATDEENRLSEAKEENGKTNEEAKDEETGETNEETASDANESAAKDARSP
jgi:solute carrier family 10 (sodium/bile acid cotransporter), member 7